ncbi:hypothetical protein SUGI_0995180 [Cryptomeria japonica]|nr:hypothetical protein SUGI_0995180 [Cryptomeria japonica]
MANLKVSGPCLKTELSIAEDTLAVFQVEKMLGESGGIKMFSSYATSFFNLTVGNSLEEFGTSDVMVN